MITVMLLLGSTLGIASTPREKKKINFDWKFNLGDIKEASQKDFDDAEWRKLDLPHDWSIEGEFKKENPSGTSGAFLPGGIGWYRKSINIEKIEEDVLYNIHFDGVYLNSDVWINGTHLGFYPNGYLGFGYDLTPYLKEGENSIAVRVDHSKLPTGRWYTGSGIYRNVWWETTHKVHVEKDGTAVTTPQVSQEKAAIHLEISVENQLSKKENVKIISTVLDANGKEVARDVQKRKISSQAVFKIDYTVHKPMLWSPDHPNMYLAKTSIEIGGVEVDNYETPFGIRYLDWVANKGLFLNGEPILMKGLSNHQDAGPLGVAVAEEVTYKRLQLLKEMGCNALRTAHHPFAPEFYTMCDTMGFMVMDEAFDGWWKTKAKYDYGLYFEKYWKQDLEKFIKRDRNHPSVVIWSVGNEVKGFTNEEQERLVAEVKKHDSTRPVTQGRGYRGTHIDIAGFNGHGEYNDVLEQYHEKYPDKLIIGTEITHTLQTRGIYRTQTWYRTKDNPAPWETPASFEKMESRIYKIPNLSEEEVFTGISPKYQSSYDNSIVRVGVRDDWNRVEEWDFYIGNFRWTGFDYLGESFNWPARTANFGIIDLAGFPKDHYYLYQSLWSDKPMVHVLPHWNHKGKENTKIPMVVYTNGDEAEMFLNGASLGRKKMTKERQIVWEVPFEVGSIEVVAYKKGKKIAAKELKTASEAYKVQVKTDDDFLIADRTDILLCEINIIDEKGIFVADAMNELTFKVVGGANIIGIENGDILDMSSSKNDLTRKAFNGKCRLILQSNGKNEDVQILVTSPNLKDGNKVIQIQTEHNF